MSSLLLIPALILASIVTIEMWREARRRAERSRSLEAREREARVQPGGSPRHPIVVQSPAEVEPHARALPCPLCGGTLRVNEHAAETLGGVRLRIAYVGCVECGAPRPIYFRIAGAAG